MSKLHNYIEIQQQYCKFKFIYFQRDLEQPSLTRRTIAVSLIVESYSSWKCIFLFNLTNKVSLAQTMNTSKIQQDRSSEGTCAVSLMAEITLIRLTLNTYTPYCMRGRPVKQTGQVEHRRRGFNLIQSLRTLQTLLHIQFLRMEVAATGEGKSKISSNDWSRLQTHSVWEMRAAE